MESSSIKHEKWWSNIIYLGIGLILGLLIEWNVLDCCPYKLTDYHNIKHSIFILCDRDKIKSDSVINEIDLTEFKK